MSGIDLSLILDIVLDSFEFFFEYSIKRKYLGEKLYQDQINVFTILNLMVLGEVGQSLNYQTTE